MRLKRLEAYGFKSFADRVTFDFEDGITAVIGPNGCGKSNIVDAVKWVIGEQSAKALRGKEMTDVIFNGCATRRPLAFCEVTLVLDQIAGADDSKELAITRRLTRDGQSSYFLNGKPGRFKDIRESLMDTGVGHSAYAVIEQGRISFILEASVKERRAILEEASGISRYKARRKVALRKLEKVDINRERIGEVLKEVDKRLRSVKAQASKALRYQELTDSLKELRLLFSLEEYGQANNKLAEHTSALTELLETITGLGGELAKIDADLQQGDVKLLQLDDELRELDEKRGEVRSRRDVAETQARDAENRLAELDLQAEEDQRLLSTANERLGTLKEEVEKLRAELSEAEATSDDPSSSKLNTQFSEKQAELDELIATIDDIIAKIEEVKSKDIEVLHLLGQNQSDLSRLEGSRKGLQDRRERLIERSGGMAESLDIAREQENEAKQIVEEAMKGAADSHIALDELIKKREESQGIAQKSEHDLAELRHEEARTDTRLRVLSENEKRLDGVHRGVRDILKEMDRFPGVRGMVADLFSVEKDYELAIETALGAQAQHIITDTQHAAKDAISFLKRERRGRATFLPLDDLWSSDKLSGGISNRPGVVGIARDFVQYDNEFDTAFHYLLGNILIVETIDDAMRLRRQERIRARMVTIEGEVVNPGGAMTGGRQQGQDNGLISRKNEIRRLEETLEEIQGKRQALENERELKRKEAFEFSVMVDNQRKAISDAERAVGDAKASLMKAERDRLHAEEFASGFTSELDEIDLETKQVDEDAEQLNTQREELDEQKNGIERQLATLQAHLSEQGEERDELQDEVNHLRVEVATTQERCEALRNQISQSQRQLADLEDNKTEREKRLASASERRESLQQQHQESSEVFAREAKAFETLASGVEDVLAGRDALRNELEAQRQQQRKQGSELRKAEQQQAQHEVRAGECRSTMSNLCERMLETYELDLAEAHSHWERPEDVDWGKLKNERDNAEKELARLGPVNLAAIDELKEVEARHGYLQRNHDDLQTAGEQLTTIIEEINNTSRRRFKQTYKEVRKNFAELFRKLFGGGKADMVLEQDVDDILEAGIDIIAQPPGKQPKSITLLSGGEKALTAIALLFAVYRTKPSPFCILDEVDAPLDESNTDVYASMVREFCNESQFIVITHNKRTMQYADAVYGITQAERGVSNKISVKLEELENAEELVETTQGAGPFAG